jgi:hypothetical protein
MAALSSAEKNNDPEPDYLGLESPPATTTELQQITSMREQLGGNDGPLLQPYLDYPEIIHDFAFLRYLRGLDHNVDDATRVFKEHLALRDKHNLNQVRAKVLHTRENYDATDFDTGPEMMQYMPLTYNAGKDPVYGHLLCYIPIGAQDSYALEANPGFDKYTQFCIEEWIARDIQLTRLSIQHNRLIKLILIIDLGGLSLTSSQVTHSAKKQWDKDWQKMLETKPENTARWYFINVPWFGVKMYNTFGKMTFPTNTIKKISLFGSDYRQQLLGKIDVSTLATLIKASRRNSIKNGEESEAEVPLKDSIVLKAGASREVVVEVLEDVMAVRWTVTATVRDIRFGVVFYRASSGGDGGGGGGGEEKGNKEDTNQVGTTKDDIVAEQVLSNKEGQITGEYVVAPPGATGLMVFELSNKHSWMRQNGVEYAIEVIQRTHDTEEQTLSLNL